MLQRFKDFIQKKSLFNKQDKLLLAISGGIDSMLMAYLFNNTEYNCTIAHCNFQLRGEDSNKDEELVIQQAQQYNFPVFTKKFDTIKYASEHKISIQMAARDLRFKWFNELKQRDNFSYIATAHHLDDKIETFFINLFRGSGLKGLKSMEEKSNEDIVRPLLFATRDEIEQFVAQHQIAYREDYTNASEKYLRNKIRHSLLPIIKDISPHYHSTFSNTFDYLSQTYELLETVLEENTKRMITPNHNILKVDRQMLKDSKFPDMHLFHILKEMNYNWDTVHSICQHIDGGSGKQFYSSTHRLLIDRTALLISPLLNDLDFSSYLIHENCSIINLPFYAKCKFINKSNEFRFSPDENVLQIDSNLLKFPLTIRKWQKGDHFYPLGLHGMKKVSDFFIDEKFSLYDKENTWILVNGNDEIIWIVGHRMDDRFKITDNTQRIFEIENIT